MYNPTRSHDRIREERDRFVAFAFASADILIELDEEGTVLFADGATLGLLGLVTTDIMGRSITEFIDRADQELLRIFKDTENTRRLQDIKIHLLSRRGEKMPFAMSGYTLSSLNNRTYLTLSLIKADIPAEELDKRDIYSGLLRKENFAQTANHKIREASRQGREVKITLLDLPELKDLLDSLPVSQANSLMNEISAYLKSKSLDGDTAGIIESSSYSLVHDASINPTQVMQDIIDITKKADPEGEGVHTHSQTIDTDPGKLTPEDSSKALLYTINKFAHSQNEGFSIHSLSEGYQNLLTDTVEKIAQFKSTVAARDFEIAFQPVVNLKTGIIHHFESLVRVEGKEQFKNPFHFITFGEEAGMISEFDLAMCDRTLEILDSISRNKIRPLVAINLSGKSLSSGLFRDALQQLLDRHPDTKGQIIFEITESSKITDFEGVNNYIQELRGRGNQCCLDDFGAGESSFEYLRTMQVDFVKIDGSYVRESMDTERGRYMLRAMTGMCRTLGIITIGEMIENEVVATFLWESGVQFGQGYLFGRPTTNTDILYDHSKSTVLYKGITKAKRVRNHQKTWWKKEG